MASSPKSSPKWWPHFKSDVAAVVVVVVVVVLFQLSPVG